MGRATFSQALVDQWLYEWDSPAGEAVDEYMRDAEAIARVLVPVRTGAMLGSIAYKHDHALSGRILGRLSAAFGAIFLDHPAHPSYTRNPGPHTRRRTRTGRRARARGTGTSIRPSDPFLTLGLDEALAARPLIEVR